MPPLRKGLIKRKLHVSEPNNTLESTSENEGSSSNEEAEWLQSELNVEGDETDSEHEEGQDAASDQETDEVLYKDDVDSTLGDEEGESASDESSELADSEADGESEDDDKSDSAEDSASDEDSSVDSGAESGPGPVSRNTTTKLPKATQKQRKAIQSKQTHKESEDSINKLADTIHSTSVSVQPVHQKDEYESGDTSDEEERRNTVGDVPMWWYDEYPHVGYDLDGRRLMKPPQRDQIDDFLKKCEDPEFWRTVRDPSTGQDVVLSREDLQLLQRLRAGRLPDPAHDDHQPWVEWFTSTVLATPLRAFPEHKRSFVASRDEQRAVGRLVHALRMGWASSRRQLAAERRRRRERHFYDLWGAAEPTARSGRALAAPRRPPPTHAESYNPPPEYLLDAGELAQWEALAETPWRRKYTFLPTRHASLRAVPAYPRYSRERFLRCLDLYLAPRAIKMRLTIRPEDLVPALPSPRELRPFPVQEALALAGHEGAVRSADFDPSGQYIASGGDDGFLKVWETASGRCVRSVRLGAGSGAGVARVAWLPAGGLPLVAACVGARLLLVAPAVGARRAVAAADRLLQEAPPAAPQPDERTAAAARWDTVEPREWALGVRLSVSHFRSVSHVAWHARGDYLCVTLQDAAARAVLVHQVSRRRSQLPFARSKGLVQCATFHPTRPLLFVATQRVVRVYDLVKQELVRKLLTGAQWISTMAVHPGGDNLLVASYDRKCMWFDLELSSKPYQTLRLHGGAVRALAFHRRYPLFASAGDDKHIVVSHGMVYNDLLQNPTLVPLKQLPAPARRDGLGVLALCWHPTQPWLLAAGADRTLRLYS